MSNAKPFLLATALSALCLLLASGCRSSSPTEYQRGTFAPPPAPTARPGVGAPVVGQPEQIRPDYPHSPHKRYLPPEPDGKPGLWAAEEPKATIDVSQPKFLDVALPFIDGNRAHADQCVAYLLEGATTTYEAVRRVQRLEPIRKQCAVAKAFAMCVLAMHEVFLAAQRTSALDAEMKAFGERLGESADLATRFSLVSCEERKIRLTREEEKAWQKIGAASMKAMGHNPSPGKM